MTAAALPIISTVGGFILNQMASNSAAKQQQSILNKAKEKESAIARRNIDLATNNAQQYDPTKRGQAQAAEETRIEGALGSALKDGNPAENTNEGNLSQDFKIGKAKAIARQNQQGLDTAKLMAKMRAPTMLRQNEAIRNADVASQIGQGASDINNIQRAAQVEAGSVQPNGLLQLAGAGLGAAGTLGMYEKMKNATKAAGKTMQLPSGTHQVFYSG